MKIYARSREIGELDKFNKYIGKDIWVRCQGLHHYPPIFYARFLNRYHDVGTNAEYVRYEEIPAITVLSKQSYYIPEASDLADCLDDPVIEQLPIRWIDITEPLSIFTTEELWELVEESKE